MTLIVALKNVHGIRNLELPPVIRLKIPTPLHRILVLTEATTLLEKLLHVELNVSLLIEQHRWSPVYRRKCTRTWFTK